jgi:hypothetical protein
LWLVLWQYLLCMLPYSTNIIVLWHLSRRILGHQVQKLPATSFWIFVYIYIYIYISNIHNHLTILLQAVWDMTFSQLCCWRTHSSGMWCCDGLQTEAQWSLLVQGTAHPAEQCHIPLHSNHHSMMFHLYEKPLHTVYVTVYPGFAKLFRKWIPSCLLVKGAEFLTRYKNVYKVQKPGNPSVIFHCQYPVEFKRHITKK